MMGTTHDWYSVWNSENGNLSAARYLFIRLPRAGPAKSASAVALTVKSSVSDSVQFINKFSLFLFHCCQFLIYITFCSDTAF